MKVIGKDSKPRQYRRSTPVGRLRSNAAKVTRHASLVQIRIMSWGEVDDERVAQVLNRMSGIQILVSEADRILEKLERSGFVPPKKSGALVYQIGQRHQLLILRRATQDEDYAARGVEQSRLDRCAQRSLLQLERLDGEQWCRDVDPVRLHRAGDTKGIPEFGAPRLAYGVLYARLPRTFRTDSGRYTDPLKQTLLARDDGRRVR